MEDYRTEDNPFGLAPGVAVCGPCGLVGGFPTAADRGEGGEEAEAERPAGEKDEAVIGER